NAGHIATALTCEAPLLCVTGSPRGVAKARKLLEIAEQVADRAGTAHAKARFVLSRGLVAFVQGHWRAAARDVDEAAELFRTQCVDVTWELATAQIFASSARFIRGDWAESGRRLNAQVREAESRGDPNVAANLRVLGCWYLSMLAMDQPAEALKQLREDVADCPHDRADFFRCNVMQAEVDIALYNNDPMRADEALRRDWPGLERALLLRSPTTFAF